MTGLSYYIPTTAEWCGSRRFQASAQCTHKQCFCMDQEIFGQIARITDHLYLSSLQALTPNRLRQLGVTQLISVMADPIPSEVTAQVERHTQIPVEDIDYSNLRRHFDEVADRIAREARRGGKTAVHCMAGVSRSATMVLAYLVKHQGMSLFEAYKYVLSIRPCIHPNIGFWRQLIAYEEAHRGYRSMRIANDGVSHSTTYPASSDGVDWIYPATKHRLHLSRQSGCFTFDGEFKEEREKLFRRVFLYEKVPSYVLPPLFQFAYLHLPGQYEGT
ncbi:Dual specificity protein phosphatase 14 [Echinococcus granulosus]|uniref:Dual specificity protein phosphatase 14 n=1 Tax=Echinococcus granulosus TaxID=6210 RepID=A0A068X1U8_ECHGR|nr:Dual specificity protein phosphatase 14 [Echinococcus granulosus]CDS23874.1 dual specificity protein phosphatase 14 [Echinococcus granulosus]